MKEYFSLQQLTISQILGAIKSDEFVIPEIQRPFVWTKTQVRDLIDSLYNGYPTGYIIVWKNPDIMTKDGKRSNGKKILIDGQQRITALMAALAGKEVLDRDFKLGRIKIAFNPFPTNDTKRFAVQDSSHLRDKKWISDISMIFDDSFNLYSFSMKYCEDNSNITPEQITNAIMELKGILYRPIGIIDLDYTLGIDKVTEIFIRINSKGTPLGQSDFVMSKMASDTKHDGNKMRKAVDYFCHLASKPDFYQQMVKDKDFAESKYFSQIKWLANDYDDIYDPDCSDMLRVAFMHQFDQRAKLSDLVCLLSGRDFKTKEYTENIIIDSYEKLDKGIVNFINQYNFEQFVMAIKGAGFVSKKLLTSYTTLDFAYTLYLLLQNDSSIPKAQIKRYVQKWFVMSMLSQRYVNSTESNMEKDMHAIAEKGFLTYFQEQEQSALSDTFWNITLPQNLETASVNSPAFCVFIASQINLNCNSLLMNGTKISDLITISGDVHHIFPKAYLKKNGIDSKSKYNQVANYIYLDTQVNKAISDDAPYKYFSKAKEQCATKNIMLGNISDFELLKQNLQENCIPESVFDMDVSSYNDFLLERRKLMAKLIERYYKGL